MDKETLSNYGWIVICVLVLAIMISLATPFGSYVADGFKAAYKGFGDTNTEVTDMMYSAVGAKAPASCGIEGHYKGDNRGEHGIPATDCTKGHRYTCECVSFVVPEGGTYTMKTAVNGKSVYTAGEALPKHYEAKRYDTYEEGDYKYTYGGIGWSVNVKDRTKTSYGKILSEIADKPVTDMHITFTGCTNLITAPIIPSSVTNMGGTFAYCTSLIVAPTIPDSVTNMESTFVNCTSLTTAPLIPENVTNLGDSIGGGPVYFGKTLYGGTFYGCTSLKTYAGSTDKDGDFSNYKIPNKVEKIKSLFYNCKSITNAPNIPNSVTSMSYTFYGCTSLTTAPTIPNSVKYMEGTFSGCKSLTTAPILPNSVECIGGHHHVANGIFSYCTSLKTYVGSTDPDGDFSNYKIPNSVTCINGMFCNCKSLVAAPIIPNSVTNMYWTFYYCTSLTGTIEINANPTEYNDCFYSTSKPIILTGTSTMLSQIAGGRSNITIQQ